MGQLNFSSSLRDRLPEKPPRKWLTVTERVKIIEQKVTEHDERITLLEEYCRIEKGLKIVK